MYDNKKIKIKIKKNLFERHGNLGTVSGGDKHVYGAIAALAETEVSGALSPSFGLFRLTTRQNCW